MRREEIVSLFHKTIIDSLPSKELRSDTEILSRQEQNHLGLVASVGQIAANRFNGVAGKKKCYAQALYFAIQIWDFVRHSQSAAQIRLKEKKHYFRDSSFNPSFCEGLEKIVVSSAKSAYRIDCIFYCFAKEGGVNEENFYSELAAVFEITTALSPQKPPAQNLSADFKKMNCRACGGKTTYEDVQWSDEASGYVCFECSSSNSF